MQPTEISAASSSTSSSNSLGFNVTDKKSSPQNYKRGGVWVGPRLGGWVMSKVPPPPYKHCLLQISTAHSTAIPFGSAELSRLIVSALWTAIPVATCTALSNKVEVRPKPRVRRTTQCSTGLPNLQGA